MEVKVIAKKGIYALKRVVEIFPRVLMTLRMLAKKTD